MEDALRSLGMAPHPASGDSAGSPAWPGGGEHGIMDASYYLDDLLRNMHGNAVEGEGGGGARGASQLQGFGHHPVQSNPLRRPSPFGLGSLSTPQARGVSQPVPQRLVAPPRPAPSSGSEEDESAELDMSSERSEQTHSQSLITHRSVRSDPGMTARGPPQRSNKRNRSALGKEGRAAEEQLRGRAGMLAPQQRVRSSARVSWKDGRGGGKEREGGRDERGTEESEEEGRRGKKGAGGGNREAVRKYRAKKKAQAREMELELEQLRHENSVLTRRSAQQAELQREVGALRALVLQLYQRLGEAPPPRLQQAATEAAHTADSDKPTADADTKLPVRSASPSLLPTGNSSTLANVVLGERERGEVPSLVAAALPDFPGTDWLAAMSAMDACQSSLTALPPHQNVPLGFSYHNAALLPNKSPLHSTIQEGLAFSAPTDHQDFGARFDSSD